jgi:hypothetical protein
MWRVLVFAISMPLSGGNVADLKATAAKLQAQRLHAPGWRGESPLLTVFKHEVRDWVESNMTGEISDPPRFATSLNSVLKEAGLLCPDGRCAADNNLGLLGEVEVSLPAHDPRWLQITTSVGIVCECDQSIYLYERQDGLWNRRLESEQRLKQTKLWLNLDHQVSCRDLYGGTFCTLGCLAIT